MKKWRKHLAKKGMLEQAFGDLTVIEAANYAIPYREDSLVDRPSINLQKSLVKTALDGSTKRIKRFQRISTAIRLSTRTVKACAAVGACTSGVCLFAGIPMIPAGIFGTTIGAAYGIADVGIANAVGIGLLGGIYLAGFYTIRRALICSVKTMDNILQRLSEKSLRITNTEKIKIQALLDSGEVSDQSVQRLLKEGNSQLPSPEPQKRDDLPSLSSFWAFNFPFESNVGIERGMRESPEGKK